MSKEVNNFSALFEKRLKIYPYFTASAFTVGIIVFGGVLLFGPSTNDSFLSFYLYLLMFVVIFVIILVITGNYLFWRCPSCHRQIAGPLTDIETLSNFNECPHCGVELLHSNKSLKSGTPESGAP